MFKGNCVSNDKNIQKKLYRTSRAIYKTSSTVPQRRPKLEAILRSGDQNSAVGEFFAGYPAATTNWSQILCTDLFTEEFFNTGCCSLYQARLLDSTQLPFVRVRAASRDVVVLHQVVNDLLDEGFPWFDVKDKIVPATLTPRDQTFAALLASATPCCLPLFAYHSLPPARATVDFLQSGQLERALGWNHLLTVQLPHLVNSETPAASLPFAADKVLVAFTQWCERRAKETEAQCEKLEVACKPLYATNPAQYCSEFQALVHRARELVRSGAVTPAAAAHDLNCARKIVSAIQDLKGRHHSKEAEAHEQFTTFGECFFNDFCMFTGDYPVLSRTVAPLLQGWVLNTFSEKSPSEPLWLRFQCYQTVVEELAKISSPEVNCNPQFHLLGYAPFTLDTNTAEKDTCKNCSTTEDHSEFQISVCKALFYHQKSGSQNAQQLEFARVLRNVLRVLLVGDSTKLPESLAVQHARTLARFRVLLPHPKRKDLDKLLLKLSCAKI